MDTGFWWVGPLNVLLNAHLGDREGDGMVTLRWIIECTGVYPEVSGLPVWRENCIWYSPLPLGAVV
jgi:hypothetical protein